MDNRRRTIIIVLSVMFGTLLSAGLFMLRKGKLDTESITSVVTNMIFAFAIIFVISVVLKKNKNERM